MLFHSTVIVCIAESCVGFFSILLLCFIMFYLRQFSVDLFLFFVLFVVLHFKTSVYWVTVVQTKNSYIIVFLPWNLCFVFYEWLSSITEKIIFTFPYLCEKKPQQSPQEIIRSFVGWHTTRCYLFTKPCKVHASLPSWSLESEKAKKAINENITHFFPIYCKFFNHFDPS